MNTEIILSTLLCCIRRFTQEYFKVSLIIAQPHAFLFKPEF